MRLTTRGKIVAAIGVLALMLGVGYVEASDQCAEFQANNNYVAAHDAGCSFDALPNGEYPYQWQP